MPLRCRLQGCRHEDATDKDGAVEGSGEARAPELLRLCLGKWQLHVVDELQHLEQVLAWDPQRERRHDGRPTGARLVRARAVNHVDVCWHRDDSRLMSRVAEHEGWSTRPQHQRWTSLPVASPCVNCVPRLNGGACQGQRNHQRVVAQSRLTLKGRVQLTCSTSSTRRRLLLSFLQVLGTHRSEALILRFELGKQSLEALILGL